VPRSAGVVGGTIHLQSPKAAELVADLVAGAGVPAVHLLAEAGDPLAVVLAREVPDHVLIMSGALGCLGRSRPERGAGQKTGSDQHRNPCHDTHVCVLPADDMTSERITARDAAEMNARSAARLIPKWDNPPHLALAFIGYRSLGARGNGLEFSPEFFRPRT
jgi:hypothetical protein